MLTFDDGKEINTRHYPGIRALGVKRWSAYLERLIGRLQCESRFKQHSTTQKATVGSPSGMFQTTDGKGAWGTGRGVPRGAIEPMTSRSEFAALRPKKSHPLPCSSKVTGKSLASLKIGSKPRG